MPTLKPVRWIGSSRDDLRDFPVEARHNIGYALHFAQIGDKHPSAKPYQGAFTAG
jgi:phage-related protein